MKYHFIGSGGSIRLSLDISASLASTSAEQLTENIHFNICQKINRLDHQKRLDS